MRRGYRFTVATCLGRILCPGDVQSIVVRVFVCPSVGASMYLHRISKRDTELMMAALLIRNRFSQFFTVGLCSKFPDPQLLICVATLPCETIMSENERQSQCSN